jgi:hypothetical protein
MEILCDIYMSTNKYDTKEKQANTGRLFNLPNMCIFKKKIESFPHGENMADLCKFVLLPSYIDGSRFV